MVHIRGLVRLLARLMHGIVALVPKCLFAVVLVLHSKKTRVNFQNFMASVTDVAKNFGEFRSSPLLVLLNDMYRSYPEVDQDVVNRIVMETKCSRQVADELLEAESTKMYEENRVRSGSLSEWYMSGNHVSTSRPRAEIKVYRLDAELPDVTQ